MPHCTQTQLCPPPTDTQTSGHKVKEERILLAGHVHVLVLCDLLNYLQMLGDDLASLVSGILHRLIQAGRSSSLEVVRIYP